MSGSGGGPLSKKRRIDRQLLIRQPQTLAEVPLDALVISELKQHLPKFGAIELLPLNKRFTKTSFEKQTVRMILTTEDDDNWVKVTLVDEWKAVPQLYKTRQCSVPVGDLARLLHSISGKGIVQTLFTEAKDPLLNVLLKQEKLTPSRFALWKVDQHQQCLLPLAKRLAGTGKVKVAEVFFGDNAIDWQQWARCLRPFTSLQRLHLYGTNEEPPLQPSNWLKKAIEANSQLKKLTVHWLIFSSANFSDDALPTIARVDSIEIEDANAEEVFDHVDEDLHGTGQFTCTLTKLVQEMPLTGRLKFGFDQGDLDEDYGDLLRICHYILSLHSFGKRVAVGTSAVPAYDLKDFVEDLGHYYFPHMETTIGTDGQRYRYRVRVGTVTIDFYS